MKPPIGFRLPRRSKKSIERDVDAELEFHINTRTSALIAQGVSATDARRRAESEFGDIDATREYCRAQDSGLERADRRHDLLDQLRGNVRFAFRSLRRNPGFAAVTLTTLALAIGANTAIFSVANAILFAPLPYADAGSVVALFEDKSTAGGTAQSDMSAADLVDYRAAQTSLTGIAMLARGGVLLRPADDDPVALQAVRVSANMFSVLGATAAHGRTFLDGEDASPPASVVVLAHDAWMRIFGGDTAALGRTLLVNDEPMTLIGVMPKGFGLGYAEDLYTPLDVTPMLRDVNRARKMHWLYGVARLKPGVTIDAARADLRRLARGLAAQYPEENSGHSVTVLPMQTALAGSAERTAYLLLAAAAVVLLVACANLMNMMLARAASRANELTVRAAIGAGRRHLVAQLVTETVVLALVGGAIGVALASVVTRSIVSISATAIPVLARPTLDWRVMIFSVLLSLAVGVLVGLIPALRVSRVELGLALRSARAAGDRRGNVLRGVFVVSQTAMAAVLLVIGGLLVRSLENLRHVELGFDASNVLVGTPVVRGPRYQTLESFNAFYDALFEQLRAIPSVTAVGAAAGLPLVGTSGCGLVIEGRPAPTNGFDEVRCSATRGDYFDAMRIPLLRGRNFSRDDLPRGTQVVIVNDAMVKKYFPGEDPLGKRLRLGPNPQAPWETIVGVIGDVRQANLESEPVPTVYEYDAQHAWGSLGIAVRTASDDPMRIAPAFRGALRAVDASLAVRTIRSMNDVIGLQLSQRRLTMTLIASFAALALVLAAVGIYGVLAFGVMSRTRELGIRRALGATAGSLRLSILRRGAVWSAAGLVIGGGAAAIIARALDTMLFGVAPTDARTFLGVVVIVAAATVLACVIPARRAVGVDPVVAMQVE